MPSGVDGLHRQAALREHVDVARWVVLMEQDGALRHRDALEVGGQARWRHTVPARGAPPRLGGRRSSSSASSHRCSPRSRSGSNGDDALGAEHAAARELGADRIGGPREHDLGPVRLRQARSPSRRRPTAEESTPVTRRRSITRNRGGVASARARIRSSRRFVEPKNTNPLTRRIWTRSRARGARRVRRAGGRRCCGRRRRT